MYRCDRCAAVPPPGTVSTEVVRETRARAYPARSYRVRGEAKERVDPGGTGEENVRVARVCPSCASRA